MASTSKVRLVVGLLGTAGELTSTLAELGAQGLMPAQINVIAQAGAFDGALAAWWENRQAPAIASLIVYRSVGGPVPWAVAAAGSDAAAPSTAVDDARALLGFHHWALRRYAQQLHLYLERGGALLLVEPDTEAGE